MIIYNIFVLLFKLVYWKGLGFSYFLIKKVFYFFFMFGLIPFYISCWFYGQMLGDVLISGLVLQEPCTIMTSGNFLIKSSLCMGFAFLI